MYHPPMGDTAPLPTVRFRRDEWIVVEPVGERVMEEVIRTRKDASTPTEDLILTALVIFVAVILSVAGVVTLAEMVARWLTGGPL